MAAAAVSADDRARFRPVTARGRYDGRRQFLIDNIVRQGRNGFFVITPFRLDEGGLLLVNRGWIAQDARRQPVDDIGVDDGARRIEGRVGRLWIRCQHRHQAVLVHHRDPRHGFGGGRIHADEGRTVSRGTKDPGVQQAGKAHVSGVLGRMQFDGTAHRRATRGFCRGLQSRVTS